MNYWELNKHSYDMLIVKYNLLLILYVIKIFINKANTVIYTALYHYIKYWELNKHCYDMLVCKL